MDMITDNDKHNKRKIIVKKSKKEHFHIQNIHLR